MSQRWSPLHAVAACLICMALAAPVILAADEAKPADTAKPATAMSAPHHNNMPPAEERAKKMTEKMKTQLNLTDEQMPKVEEINLRTAQSTDAATQAAGTKEERMAKVKAAQEQRDKDLKDVLNPDQWKKYEQVKNEMKQGAHSKAQAHAKNTTHTH